MTRPGYSRFAGAAAVLALAVIMLGGYVRLSDAGLGCPDWPGCYGRLVAPSHPDAVAEANAAYPHRPVETPKAWKEMLHRYLASFLGLLVLVLAAVPWTRHGRRLPRVLPGLLLALVVFQGLLGMWTVILLVNPTIVTAHLAGGMATLALLWWLRLCTAAPPPEPSPGLVRLRPWLIGGLVVLCFQILLGGWTSTHYAAIACMEFPTCHGGSWWPETDFAAGFALWRPIGPDYELGRLDGPARVAIHLIHRLGALTVLAYLGTIAVVAFKRSNTPMERIRASALGLVLVIQIGLGVTNVVARLPLSVAVAHTGGAAILLLTLLTLIHHSAGFRAALNRTAAAGGRRTIIEGAA